MSRERKLYISELIKRNINEQIVINIKKDNSTLIFSSENVPKEYLDKQCIKWYMANTLTNKILVIYI